MKGKCITAPGLLAVLLFPLFFSGALQAQTADTIRKEIPEVIVSATRTPEDPAGVARSVTLLQKGKINELQSQDAGQLLSMQQGISVAGAGQNPGLTQTLFMRGTNSHHTLVMIDGVRLSDPSSVNNALDLVEIPLSGFEQIEIVRGSHSTLFGSSGIGGVVNLISAGRQSPGLHADLRLRGGVFGKNTLLLEENLEMNYSGKSGWYGNLNVFNTHIEGLDATVDTVTITEAFKSYDTDNLRLFKSSGKIGFQNAKWDVFASYAGMKQVTDFDKSGWKFHNPYGPNPLAWYDGDSTSITAFRNLVTYRAACQLHPSLIVLLQGGITSLSREVADDSSVVDEWGTYDHTVSTAVYSGGNTNHDVQFTWLQKNLKVIGGAGLLYEHMTFENAFYTNSGFGPYESYTNLDSLNLHASIYHAYAQADLSGNIVGEELNKLRLLTGLRFSYHDLFGSEINYEIIPSLRVTPASLIYFSASTGFNAPSLYQLYSPEVYYTSTVTRGNPALGPERSVSFELGFKQQVGKNVEWEISLYQNKIRDEIEYVYLWDGSIPIDSLGADFLRDDFRGDTYLNVGTLTSRGLEISASAQISRRFSAGGNLNLVQGHLTYDPATLDTSHTGSSHIQLYSNGAFLSTDEIKTDGLTRRPSTANIFLHYQPVDRLSLGLTTRWIGQHSDIYYDYSLSPFGALNTTALEGYVLFDVLAAFRISDVFSASLKAENLFNTDYVDLRGFTSRGRGIYLTLRASL
jgi:vitamin B12 transporter